ncbi:MAG TPA: RluA family pseudouridine synthase [Candidatus Acidoferrales bacterium]|nr:RluA family pseudouridine synthase [Candidatus Acidoferrales bacterium]
MPDYFDSDDDASEHDDTFAIDEETAGQRLDRFLATHLSDISRTHVQSLIDDGRVLVDGSAKKSSHRLEAGETITVNIPAPPLPGVEAENIPLDIIYEDEDVAVVNKPAGMIVHPGAGVDSGTLVAALLHRFEGGKGLSTVGGPLRPGIVHRIDKGTSGVLLIARTDMAHLKLVEDFQERRIEKTYLALLHGKLKGKSGVVELPIARDLRRRSRMTARRREGREARTDWRLLQGLGNFSFIEAGLHTGRTHQIRVHFSALGCPVVGDTVYGAPRQERIGKELLPPLERNFLHAARIAFNHPRSGKRIECRAPLPPNLAAYFRDLGRAEKIPSSVIDAGLREFL